MSRVLAVAYGVIAYAIFFVTFLYAIGFVGDFLVPKSVDSGGPAASMGEALIVNLLLLSLFAAQHSGMARPGFKRWWTRFVPRPLERSTYVLLASLILILVFWQWRPMSGVVWEVEGPLGLAVLWGLFALGWVIVLLATFLINHFDLFGLRQVWLYLRGREYTPLPFRTTGFYKYVRHPLLLGFIIAFWSIPRMTVGHLVFAIVTTGYVVVAALFFEEPDLVTDHGDLYREYRKRVPAFIPVPGRRADEAAIRAAVRSQGAPVPGDAEAPRDTPAGGAPTAGGPLPVDRAGEDPEDPFG